MEETGSFLRAPDVVVGAADHNVKNERNIRCFFGASDGVVGVADYTVKNGRNTRCFLGESLDAIPSETLGTRNTD